MPLIIKSDIVSFLSQLTSFLDPEHKEPERQVGRRNAQVRNAVPCVRQAPGSYETEVDAVAETIGQSRVVFAEDRIDDPLADQLRRIGVGRGVGVNVLQLDLLNDEDGAHLDRQK